MRIALQINHDGIVLDKIYAGVTAESIVREMKADIAHQVGPPGSIIINMMDEKQFISEAVGIINTKKSIAIAIPKNCSQFLKIAIELGHAKQLED